MDSFTSAEGGHVTHIRGVCYNGHVPREVISTKVSGPKAKSRNAPVISPSKAQRTSRAPRGLGSSSDRTVEVSHPELKPLEKAFAFAERESPLFWRGEEGAIKANLRQRIARRSFLLEKASSSFREFLEDQGEGRLYLALNPYLSEKEALRLLEENPDLAYYLAMNPSAMRSRRVVEAILHQLEANSYEPFQPFSLEGRALRGMLSVLSSYPKPLRKRILRLAAKHGVKGPDLELEVVPSP
jgi:hypothetical protein